MKTIYDKLYDETISNFNSYVELLYITALSGKPENKQVTVENIELFVKKRGYIENYMLGKRIYTKGFVCINIDVFVEIWIDIPNNNNKFIIPFNQLITYLPTALNYLKKYEL